MPPTVSVVIPVFNRAAVVRRAIASVLSQTCQDLEVIVVTTARRIRSTSPLRRYVIHASGWFDISAISAAAPQGTQGFRREPDPMSRSRALMTSGSQQSSPSNWPRLSVGVNGWRWCTPEASGSTQMEA
jgi:cellulose synthase/poly-beta-1,6-N-acetylglucosamine synthase-like glycosyltransferase